MTWSLLIIFGIRGGYRPGRYKARFAFALALSLVIHAFVLSLRFGMAGLGLPGLALPWAERRAFSSDLRVRLAEAPRARTVPAAPAAIEPVRPPSTGQVLAVQPPPRPTVARPPVPRAVAAPTPATGKKRRQPRTKQPVQSVARAAPALKAPTSLPVPPVEARKVPAPIEPAVREAVLRPRAQPEIIAQTEPQQETFSVPLPVNRVPEPVPEVAAKQVEEPPAKRSEPAARAPEPPKADEETARLAREQEAAKLEQARRQEEVRRQQEARLQEQAEKAEQARKQEQAQQAVALAQQRALELESRRQEELKKQEEAARQQAAAIERQRALELEIRRQAETKKQEEEARTAMEAQAAERKQAQELARQREREAQAEELAAKARAARELAARAEALAASQRQGEAVRGAADGPRAPPVEPGRSAGGAIGPGNLSGRDLAAKALEQLRTPGAFRPEPPRELSPSSPPVADNSRRRPVGGGFERDIGLRMYVESWRWKTERNGNLNYPSGARTRAAENPVVTVAIRRDGSVEDVHIHRSSGQRDLDQAVRRIVQLNAPYSAFPPDLARAYDVIEIRRVWLFSDTLRIIEELN